MAYWTRVKQLADDDHHPLAFRHGGGACLGVLGVVIVDGEAASQQSLGCLQRGPWNLVPAALW